MRNFLFILFVSTCLVFGCNSNKKSSKKSHGKKGKYSASSGSSGGGKSMSSDSMTSMKFVKKKRAYGEGRPKINTGGAVGVGTGGSYAANSYRSDIIGRNDAKKAYFKKRMEEEDRMYYGEEVREEVPLVQQDSMSTDSTMLEMESEQIQADSTIFSLDK